MRNALNSLAEEKFILSLASPKQRQSLMLSRIPQATCGRSGDARGRPCRILLKHRHIAAHFLPSRASCLRIGPDFTKRPTTLRDVENRPDPEAPS